MKTFLLVNLLMIIASAFTGYAEELGKVVQKDGITYQQFFYKSGKLKSEVPIVNKKAHGACYGWYESGEFHYIVSFVEGNIKNIISFDKNGKIIKISNHGNGNLISDIYYYPTGIIKSAYNMQIGGKKGQINQRFNENGEVYFEK
ncbi:MAG: hypothetical protein LBK76_12040 [Verrucomicrobiales bacterium]|jgi:antitoxin component YwqK of YwqJK toxin-antitoxin module|nr:hypothetical protein [Verrucomicrobiales bacterium]